MKKTNKFVSLALLAFSLLSACGKAPVNNDLVFDIGKVGELELSGYGLANAITFNATVLPANATNKALRWELDTADLHNSGALQIVPDSETATSIKVYALGKFTGSATLTVGSVDNPGTAATATLTSYLAVDGYFFDSNYGNANYDEATKKLTFTNVGDSWDQDIVLETTLYQSTEHKSPKVSSYKVSIADKTVLEELTNGTGDITIKAKKVGTTTITITPDDPKSEVQPLVITAEVKRTPVQSISIDKPSYEF